MKKLVNTDGSIRFGIYDEPVELVNYEDHPIETPVGIKIPSFLRKLKANQFLFAGIIGPEYIAGLAIVDLKMAANGFFYLYDRRTKELTETKASTIPSPEIFIEPCPDKVKGGFKSKDLEIEMDNGHIYARGKGIELDVRLNLDDISPLRICTRAGYRDWVYVQKTNPIKLEGSITKGNVKTDISAPQYLASLDWTSGYMRRKTCWNWASASHQLEDNRIFGMNLSCGVNETSFTENAFWIDGKMTKVDTVNFEFDGHDLYKPWHVTSFDKKVDLEFTPEAHRGENLNAIVVASRFTQMMGTFKGTLLTDKGETIKIESCPGYTEDHYAKW